MTIAIVERFPLLFATFLRVKRATTIAVAIVGRVTDNYMVSIIEKKPLASVLDKRQIQKINKRYY